jgi:hypothetical protein
MILVIGVPFSGIIIIYMAIVRFTRRTNVTSAIVSNVLIVSKRNLYVLKHTLTLIGILGTAGLPSTVVIIWNAISPGQVPVPFYLACVLNVSLCINVQIIFIFSMNRGIRSALHNDWQRLRRSVLQLQ